LGKAFSFRKKKIESALKNVNAKAVPSGQDFMEVKKQLAKLKQQIQQDEKWMFEYEETIDRYKKELENICH